MGMFSNESMKVMAHMDTTRPAPVGRQIVANSVTETDVKYRSQNQYSGLARAMSKYLGSIGCRTAALKLRTLAAVGSPQAIINTLYMVAQQEDPQRRDLAKVADRRIRARDEAVADLLGGSLPPDGEPVDTEEDVHAGYSATDHPMPRATGMSLSPQFFELVPMVLVAHRHTGRVGSLVAVAKGQVVVDWDDGGRSSEDVADTLWKAADSGEPTNARMNELASDIDGRMDEAISQTKTDTPKREDPKVSRAAWFVEAADDLKPPAPAREPEEGVPTSVPEPSHDLGGGDDDFLHGLSQEALRRHAAIATSKFERALATGDYAAAEKADAVLAKIEELTGSDNAPVVQNATEEKDAPLLTNAEDAKPSRDAVTEPDPAGEVQGNSPMNQGQDITPPSVQESTEQNAQDMMDSPLQSTSALKEGSRVAIDWASSIYHTATGTLQGFDGEYAVVILDSDDDRRPKHVGRQYVVAEDRLHGVTDAVMDQTGMDFYATDPHANMQPTSHDHIAEDLTWPDPNAAATPPKGAANGGVLPQVGSQSGGQFLTAADQSMGATPMPGAHKFEHTSWNDIAHEARAQGIDPIAAARARPMSQQQTNAALGVLGL